ncbi:RDD family protein, partial [Cellulomonas sp. IC4_254]|uniref:RDD family protein n=1 Tax=Cellulomonas sp. IC4_254 TaxID=2714040 RepID=UPI00142498EE
MSSTTGGVVPPSAPPAPVGRRVAAYLVDAALTSVAAAPLWLAWAPAFAATVRAAAASGSGAAVPEPAAPSGVLLAVGAVLLVGWGVAQWVWNGTRGWTVGRRLLGLRLVDVRSGRPVGLGRAFVRALVVALGALACGVGQLVVLLSPLFDSSGRRRGWHDRVGEGVVVDVRGLVPARRVADWADRPARTRDTADDGPAWPGVPHPAAPGDARAAADRPAVDPTPSEPTRTRWSALAADRRLDAPGLVLPPLGAPGLGPDLDTRQIPVVRAAVVPAHPGAPVPLAPAPEATAPAAGPAAPAPLAPAPGPAAPAAPVAPWLAAAAPAPGPAPAHEPAP